MLICKERFNLRPWKPEDVSSLARYADNITLWNNVRDSFPHPYTEQDAIRYIDMVSGCDVPMDLAIEVNGEAVGGIGFIRQSDVERHSAELGYWIGEPFWNQGIVTQAVQAAIEYLFQSTDIIRVFATVYAHNQASIRVLEKSGFRKVGIMEKAAYKNGRLVDFHFYEKISDNPDIRKLL